MRTASAMLSVSVTASLLGLLAAGAAGCSSTSGDPAPGASSGTTAGTSGGTTTPAPKVPPKGAPADAPPVDPTNDPSLAACTGTPGQLDALVPKKLTLGDDVPLCKFDGNVLLIVNVASHCGNTPQYASTTGSTRSRAARHPTATPATCSGTSRSTSSIATARS
jgi:hypothetical protein